MSWECVLTWHDAAGSTVDIHGKQFHPTWTRLAATARTQDDRVYLQEAVNWEVGQQVVVTTTVYKDKEDPQNEVRTIAAVSSNRKVIQFTQPLDFTHYAGQEYQVCAPLACGDHSQCHERMKAILISFILSAPRPKSRSCRDALSCRATLAQRTTSSEPKSGYEALPWGTAATNWLT